MPVPQNYVDNLENLRLVTSVALEHVQDNRDQFAKCATGIQVRQAVKSICQIRSLTVQLDREFTILEYLIDEDDPVSPATVQKDKHQDG